MATEAKELLNTQETVVVYQINPPVGPDPIRMTCPHCQKTMSTYIENKASARTHSLCIVLSLIGCFLCAPYVYFNEDYLAKEHFCVKCRKCILCVQYVYRTDECRQKGHWCPICENYLGTYDD